MDRATAFQAPAEPGRMRGVVALARRSDRDLIRPFGGDSRRLLQEQRPECPGVSTKPEKFPHEPANRDDRAAPRAIASRLNTGRRAPVKSRRLAMHVFCLQLAEARLKRGGMPCVGRRAGGATVSPRPNVLRRRRKGRLAHFLASRRPRVAHGSHAGRRLMPDLEPAVNKQPPCSSRSVC